MVRPAAVSSEFQRVRVEVWRDLAKMENVKGDRVHKTQLLLGKGLTLGPEIWIAIPSQKLGNNVCIDVCPFSFSQTLFPAAWMFWQSLKFSFSSYLLFLTPIFTLLSSWHKQNPLTTHHDHSLLTLILSYWGLTHRSKTTLFCTVFLPALKRTDSHLDHLGLDVALL